jgi:hypothetical protein
MENKEALDFIVGAIKNRRKQVVSFISSKGGSVKKTDSDVAVGKELSKVLANNKKNQDEFVLALKPMNASGIDPISVIGSSISDIFTSSTNRKTAEQQGSDAITLALINAGIAKDSNNSNTPLIIGAIAAFMILGLVGFLIYKKYSK